MDKNRGYVLPMCMPGFLERTPKSILTCNVLPKSKNIKAFDSENLRRMMIPAYEWGITKPPFARPDVVTGRKEAVVNKNISTSHLKPRLMPPGRDIQVESFYKIFQTQRELIRDVSGFKKALTFFDLDEYKYQCSPNFTGIYSSICPSYCQMKPPQIYPVTLDRTQNIPPTTQRSLGRRFSLSEDMRRNR